MIHDDFDIEMLDRAEILAMEEAELKKAWRDKLKRRDLRRARADRAHWLDRWQAEREA